MRQPPDDVTPRMQSEETLPDMQHQFMPGYFLLCPRLFHAEAHQRNTKPVACARIHASQFLLQKCVRLSPTLSGPTDAVLIAASAYRQ